MTNYRKPSSSSYEPSKPSYSNIDFDTFPHIFYCSCCGKGTLTSESFYKMSSNPNLVGNQSYATICKKCINEHFNKYYETYNDERIALILCCAEMDWYFSENNYQSVKEESGVIFSLGKYAKLLNLGQNKLKTFKDTLLADIMNKNSFGANDVKEKRENPCTFTREEHSAREEIITVIGYDPFGEYPLDDKKFLYKETVKYFDEDSSEDTYKLSQIIQIMNNNNQIRHYDSIITSMNAIKTKTVEDIKMIASLNTLKNALVQANDKIAKENEISVKNRSNKEAGKSTLTYLQKKLRELDFDKAEVNYYNQLKSKGTQWAADMSFKAIQQNGFFNDNDLQEICNIRRELVEKLQSENDDLREEARLLNVRIQELETRLNDLNVYTLSDDDYEIENDDNVETDDNDGENYD